MVNHGDCIDGMKALDASGIDLVFADPPFNIGYEYDAYDDRQDHERYLAWCRDWMAEVHRVLKPDGAFWLAIGDEYAAELKLIAQNAYPGLALTGDSPSLAEGNGAARRKGKQRKPMGSTGRAGGFYCRSWVIWYYTFGVNCKTKFTRSHAHLFHFVKDPKRFTFNARSVGVPSARQLVYGDRRADPEGRTPDDTWIIPPSLDAPTKDGFILRPQDIPDRFEPESDTWFFSRVAGTFKERAGWHGCQMPEQLLGRVIRATSNEGGTVLDPFAGSGTTLVVAKKLARIPIGFEMSKQYAAQAQGRLAKVKAGDALDGPEDPLISAPSTRNGRRLDEKVAGKPRRRRGRQSVPASLFVDVTG